MNVRHIANLSSLVLGMVGSLYLSYDLFGDKRGILRRFVMGITMGIIGAVLGIVFFSLPILVLSSQRQDILIPILGVGGMSLELFIGGFWMGEMYTREDAEVKRNRAFWYKFNIVLFGVVMPIMLLFLLVSFGQSIKGWEIAFSAGIGVVIIATYSVARVLIFRVSHWAFNTDQKRLGAIGAFLTFAAFAMQFWLAW